VALLQGGAITHVGTHAQLLASVRSNRYLLAADDELDDGAERALLRGRTTRTATGSGTPIGAGGREPGAR